VPRSLLRPALFFDFDNTLTHGDVLDELIERYSPNESWRDWENAWQHGQLAARDCLRLQIENLRVTREELLADVARVRIDPAFVDIIDWARLHGVAVCIVSDSFLPLIERILEANGIYGIQVFANDLQFAPGDRLIPSFPYHDPLSACSANAKARHLVPQRARNRIIFAGDGYSDLDAALVADVVFAKSTLASELDARGIAFYPFDTLEPILAFLETVPLPHAEPRLARANRLAK
jgi:2-hydroxy-3-keto-5-methylthiopentenyl-1-phosphate phosphatase